MEFSPGEIAVIDGAIGSIYSHMASQPKLQSDYWKIHEHLQSGIIDKADLPRIQSALELVTLDKC